MAEVLQIDPNTLQPQVFSPKDDAIVPSFEIDSLFSPEESKIEFFIYDLNNNLLTADYNYRNWRTIDDPSLVKTGEISTIEVKPGDDVVQYGFDTGKINTIYNFVNYQLDSSPVNLYYISDISSDRTELRLKTNIFENEQIENAFAEFQTNVLDTDFFDEFYINLGNNNLFIAVNAQLDTTTDETAILIKLYEPLPTQYQTKDEIYVVTKVAESVGYQVLFEEVIEVFDDLIYLRGPNTALDLNAQTNNSSEYQNYNELESTPLSSSFYQLKQIANQKGIKLNVDYTSYSNFVYFSSAKTRLENFYYKVELIETYQSQSDEIEGFSNVPVAQSSGSSGVYKSKIRDIIENFDGYEYYLYYSSESKAYPKQNTQEPYILYSYSSSDAKDWLGSANESSAYYGGELLSSSLYDNLNQNNLHYATPEFIREDSDNNPYELFINMMGQHFDNLWLYTKQVTEKLDRDNRVAYGISKDLVADTLRSLGTKLYGGGFAIEDVYTNFLGYNTDGSLLPPTGSELITNYITASGDPVPLDDAHKELYKRLYNNLPYLLKKKGTIEGIRNLITIYGIPQTILRISEFGGKDKYNSNDYDYTYDRYSYALKTQMSASALIPWKPLVNSTANNTAYVDIGYFKPLYTIDVGGDTDEGFNFPNSIQFRFNAEGIPTNTRYSQSIFVKKNPTIEDTANSQSFDFGVFLTYDPSVLDSGSYSGSVQSPYKNYGNLELVVSESTGYVSSSVYLPFYDGKWWSGMVTRYLPSGSATGSYTLYAGNNIYNGPDGDKIGFTGSTSIDSTDHGFWRQYSSASVGSDGIWFGGYLSGSYAGGRTFAPNNTKFSGSLQEFRYASHVLGEGIFNDFVMNPESIEGVTIEGSGSSFNTVAFRAPLGNELFELTSSVYNYHSHSMKSMHPAVTASAQSQIIPSFIYSGSGASIVSSSLYRVIWESGSLTGSYADKHTETYYLDQPVAGLKNRITDKIKIADSIVEGRVLSNQISIAQNPIISESYMRDVSLLEVAFSPQNEINDDIIQSFGYFNLGEYIGDPRFISSSARTYDDLDALQLEYFKKYYKQYNIFDYVRLIKYFDNSLFKMIKDYVPARTAVNTGVVIKQHILERNRQRPPQMDYTIPEYTSSIDVGDFNGGAGGSVNQYNTASFNQSYTQSVVGLLGEVVSIHDSQEEFYNGEYSGSHEIVTTQSLNAQNTYKYTGEGSMSIPSGTVNLPFDLSPYNILVNNVTGSRKDDNIQVVDYLTDATFPTNFTLILSSSAEKAQVNKSFFTTKANIDPRYDGCELTSLDYNNYTGPGAVTSSFSDEIYPNFKGDVSYGSTAVIDKHPTYFAHFTKGISTMESFNEMEFTIDYLIPSDADVPDNINSIGEIPGLLKVNGNGAYQYITSNNFEKGRRCSVDFSKDKNISRFDPSGSIQWGSLETGSYNILQGGSKYEVIISNQLFPTDQLTQLNNITDNTTLNLASSYLIFNSGSSVLPINQFKGGTDHPFIITGSNKLMLGGNGNKDISFFSITKMTPLSWVWLYNTFNYNAGVGYSEHFWYKGNKGQTDTVGGLVTGYKENDLQLVDFESGDKVEIRMTSQSGDTVIFELERGYEFEVVSTTGLGDDVHAVGWNCFPDPLDYNLTNTASFAIRRKIDQDNKVILNIPNINGMITSGSLPTYATNTGFAGTSIGVPTDSRTYYPVGDDVPSSDGFLIPDDFTQDNKDKVGKLIAILKGNNVFD